MKSLFAAYLVVTIALSFTFDVWTGTLFALGPLGAEVGGAVMRIAAERGDYAIGFLFALLGGPFGTWLGL